LHPVTAVLAALFVGWLLLRSFPQSKTRQLAMGVVLLLVAQCGLGVADIVLLAPLWMQILHLLGADVLWVALVLLAARVCVIDREPLPA
jgi:cytochrome c oxidase assembly protein subunit 15